jgi:ubiquinone/menaquinone biosynthesis C-methylase UbiE
VSTETRPNRYADDWNAYSAAWGEHYGTRYTHLGDEWCDDGSATRERDRRLFAQVAEPWLHPQSRVLEIGPGGGKWTVRIAPKVGHLTVFDVAQTMIDRTRARCDAAGLANVSYQLGDGRGFAPLPDASQDLVWSYDVFVHIALEDTAAYLLEISRVLVDGGLVVLHHAVNDTAPAMDRIETFNDWYRDGHTLGQYYYHSREALDRLYARAGLRVKTMSTEYCTVVVVAEKPRDTVAPALERALRLLATAKNAEAVDAAVDAVNAVGAEVQSRLARLTADARTSQPGQPRYAAIQKIRTLLRG